MSSRGNLSTSPGVSSPTAEHVRRTSAALARLDPEALTAVEDLLRAARAQRRRVLTFGNGGSAATALHLAADLTLLPPIDGVAFDVVCLNGNPAVVSALANDHGYESVFLRQLGHVRKGDVVIGISASGNSPNCVGALMRARLLGATTVAIVGFDGGAMRELADVVVHAEVDDYRVAEDVHVVACHAVASALAR
jgi:D-sedoheptulose 7-phosphate isomerase